MKYNHCISVLYDAGTGTVPELEEKKEEPLAPPKKGAILHHILKGRRFFDAREIGLKTVSGVFPAFLMENEMENERRNDDH